jgi:DNA-3-methyladenine glycosylase
MYNSGMPAKTHRLRRDFFSRDTLVVARDLLGKRLVRFDRGRRLSGLIIETEAYRGEEDQGCHCRAGKTARTEVMYDKPGLAYVYFVYGMHWLFNIVTEKEDYPGAVLIRALLPEEGKDVFAERRSGQPPERWMDGPAKLCQALGIDGSHNSRDLCSPEAELFVEQAVEVPPEAVHRSARIGLNSVPEPWKSIPWRFTIDSDNLS